MGIYFFQLEEAMVELDKAAHITDLLLQLCFVFVRATFCHKLPSVCETHTFLATVYLFGPMVTNERGLLPAKYSRHYVEAGKSHGSPWVERRSLIIFLFSPIEASV